MNYNLFSGFSVNISKARLSLLEEQSGQNATTVIETTIEDVLKATTLHRYKQSVFTIQRITKLFEKAKRLLYPKGEIQCQLIARKYAI